MALAIRNQADFISGSVFGFVGVAALVFGREYSFGSLASIGPGFFPTVAGVMLCGFALVLLLRSVLTQDQEQVSLAPLPIIVIVGSSVLFALILRPLGLPLSACILVLISTYASRSLGLLPALVLACAIAAFVTLVFIYGLGLQMPIVGTALRTLM